MTTKLIDNEAFYGYRVRRTARGKLYQEYFSLKLNHKRLRGAARKSVLQEAEARDLVLLNKQKKAKKAFKADDCFKKNGEVSGIRYLVKTEKSGNKTPIFQLGFMSELEDKIICTSRSTIAHGVYGAWKLAVDFYCKHKKIRKGTKLYKKILGAIIGYYIGDKVI